MARIKRFRRRLTGLLLLSLIPAAGMIMFASNEQRLDLLSSSRVSAQNYARLAALDVERDIAAMRDLVLAVSLFPGLHKLDTLTCDSVLSEFQGQYPDLLNLGVIDLSGKMLCSSVSNDSSVIDLSDRDYFKSALHSNDFAVSGYFVGRATGLGSIAVSVPIRDEGGRPLAVVFAATRFDGFQRIAERIAPEPDDFILVLDRYGTVVARYPDDDQWKGRNVRDHSMTTKIMALEAGQRLMLSLDGIERRIAFESVSAFGQPAFYVAIGVDERRIEAVARRTLIFGALGIVLIGLAGLAILWFGGLRLFGQRIDAVISTIGRFSAGDWTARVAEVADHGADEVDQIARSINDMADIVESTEESLRMSWRAIESAANGILICDALKEDIPIVYANPAFQRITGYSSAEVVGRNARFLNRGSEDEACVAEIRLAVSEFREVHAVLRNYRKGGEMFWNDMLIAPVRDEHGVVTHFVGIISDVTANKRYETELAHLAGHDALTGLPNRHLLGDRLEQALILARRSGSCVAVLFVDLDRFKVINDGLGHQVGDRLLQAVARRLSACMRAGDTVARYGGDEFVVICQGIEREDMVAQTVQRICDALDDSVLLEGHNLRVSASIGISLYPDDGAEAGTILRNADLAMYLAKESGRSQSCRFVPKLSERVSERVRIESLMRQALEKGEFELYYQPQVNSTSGEISGLEALLRWNHPEHGQIPPGQFLHVAEESGLIVQIGEWAIREACRQMSVLTAIHESRVPISVNVSVAQLKRSDFCSTVRQALQHSGLDPSLLELEITESLVMENSEALVGLLRELKSIGVSVAIDDFGTGYSNLGYLKNLPVDRLKIDRCFVRDITEDPDDAAICRAIISVAHNLRLSVVAEGVECEAQAIYLGRHFCDDLQGYFFSQPVSSERLRLLLAQQPLFSPPSMLRSMRTLLIVDDEANVLAALRRLLRRDGYFILTAESPEEAFAALASHEVQVVIADQRVGGGLEGGAFFERVKELYPSTLRIVLTGFTDLDAVTSSVNRGGVYKFLLKPWDNDALRMELREAFWNVELNRSSTRTSAEALD